MPTEVIRQNRKIFYSVQKFSNESIAQWLWRIREYLDGCEFGAVAEFLLIDKFICELADDDVCKFNNFELWSLTQLEQIVQDQKCGIIENIQTEEYANPNDIFDIKMDIVSTKQDFSLFSCFLA